MSAVVIGLTSGLRRASSRPGCAGFVSAVHDAPARYDARPHWGELHLFDRDDLERVLARRRDFVAVRRAVDPQAVFLNRSLDALFR